jgi:hypothetical protein
MRRAEDRLGDDEQALLNCLPPGGSAVGARAVYQELGWDEESWATACGELEDRGYLLRDQDNGGTVRRDMTGVPPEFRPACGRPGAHVTVRQVPVTIARAVCDLIGVTLSYR